MNFRPNINLHISELFPSSPSYADEHLTVHHLHVLPIDDPGFLPGSSTCSSLENRDPSLSSKIGLVNEFFKRTELLSDGCADHKKSERLQSGQAPKRFRQEATPHPLMYSPLPPVFPSRVSISYICHAADIAGKFDPVAAKALGLKPGPLYAKLKAGKSVLTPDGVEIRPEQCVEPNRKGPVFLVVDCPTMAYIPGLVNHPGFQPYVTGVHTVSTIFHMAGPDVLASPEYIAWMASFGQQAHHILASPDVSSSTLNFLRSAQMQLALSKLDKNIFSVPFNDYRPKMSLDQLKLPDTAIASVPRLQVHLDPAPVVELPNSRFILPLDDPESAPQLGLSKMDAYMSQAKKCENIKSSEQSKGPFLTTLGTGSALPSLVRNVSANLVTLPNGPMMLLDSGEGTMGQVFRHLGMPPFRHPKSGHSTLDFIDKLQLIYISHPHADHHLGLISILIEVQRLRSSIPRFLIMPYSMFKWLNEYSQVEPLGLESWTFIDSRSLLKSDFIPNQKVADKIDFMYRELKLKEVQTCVVQHCQHAYGVRIDLEDGFSFVYSGDTRPCPSLVTLGLETDLLLHEATMNDDLLDQARAKRHSTLSEALSQASKMKARQVILTHFSQRYPSGVRLDHTKMPVATAFDLMCLDISPKSNDLSHFSKFYKSLNSLYCSESFLDEEANKDLV